MTEAYDWNPMPHKVDINCPSCGSHDEFEFAEVVKISLKKDVPFFECSDLFTYRLFKDSCGHRWHGAVYFAKMHGGSTAAIRDLPDGYESSNWNHSKYLYRNHGLDIGSFTCSSCNARRIHELSWPEEAFYSIAYKGQLLWAFNRNSGVDLRNFIQSSERKAKNHKWASFLLHIPTIFKKQNARDNVVKQLNKLLSC